MGRGFPFTLGAIEGPGGGLRVVAEHPFQAAAR
jgi:hypothetical protein